MLIMRYKFSTIGEILIMRKYPPISYPTFGKIKFRKKLHKESKVERN